MRSVDVKRVRVPVLQKLLYHHHVTAQQAQIANGIKTVLNAGFLARALQHIIR